MMSIYFQILWRQKLMLILTTLATVAVVAGAMWRNEPRYTASTKLRVVPFGIDTPDYGTFLYFEQLSKTFIAMLEGESLQAEAKQQLGLENLSVVKIKEIAGTELLEIAVTSEDPMKAYQVSDTLAGLLIKRVQSQYISSVDNIESTIGTRIESLDLEIGQLVQEWAYLDNQIPRDYTRLAVLDREIATREETRNQLVASYNQVLVAQATQANAISIVEPAILPLEPSKPNRSLYLITAGMLGLIGGVSFVFALETVNPRLYSEQQIEKTSGFRVIGRVPPLGHQNDSNVFAKNSAGAESMRRLRARIVESLDTHPCRSILAISLNENTYTAIVTANVAISLAVVYRKVTVVDTDTRKPSLHDLWNLPNRVGFSDVLDKRAELAEVLQEGPIRNLQVITAGTADEETVERITSSAFADMLDVLRQESDVIVLNGPPLMPCAESIAIAEKVSNILLVIQKNSSKREIETVRRELQHVASKVLGIALIDTR